MTFSALLQALRRHVVVGTLLVLLGTAGGYVVSMMTPASYTVTSLVYFGVTGAKDTTALSQGNTFVHDQMPTYSALLTSSTVLSKAAEKLGVANAAGSLRHSISVSVPTDSTVMSITAEGASPDEAAARAAAVTGALTSEVARLEAQPGMTTPPVRAQVVGAPTTDGATKVDDTRLCVAMGLVAGLLAALALAAVVAARSARDR